MHNTYGGHVLLHVLPASPGGLVDLDIDVFRTDHDFIIVLKLRQHFHQRE